MIYYKKLLIVALVSIFIPLSKGYAEKLSSIDLEILGKPISAIKKNYSCAPSMISGPSKRKIICVSPSEKLIISLVRNSIVSVQVIQFTRETSIKNVLNSYSESCRKGVESNFILELTCEEQKAIILKLDIIDSEIRTEFCYFQHCDSRDN